MACSLSTSTGRTGQVQLLAAYECLFATAQAFFLLPACNVAELDVGARVRPCPRGCLTAQADEPQWTTLTLNRRVGGDGRGSLRVRRREKASHSSLTHETGAGPAPCNDAVSAAVSYGSSYALSLIILRALWESHGFSAITTWTVAPPAHKKSRGH